LKEYKIEIDKNMSLKLASNMSSQLAVNIKSAKVSFKSVLELLYDKDPDMVDRLISELQESKTKPESKTDKSPMTQEEKDARKQSREDKKQHIVQFILDNGGEEAVSAKQIADEKKKYDKKKRENKSVETTNVDTPKTESNDFVETSKPSELVKTSKPSELVKTSEPEPESETESCNDFVVEESELEEESSDVENEKEKVEKKKVEKKKKKVEKEKEKSGKGKGKKSRIPETSSDSE
jgi:hypothetical protein